MQYNLCNHMTIMKRDYLIIYVVTKILTKEICFGFFAAFVFLECDNL